MPKINRIRIVNFYYNNDVRHIVDETFSFYGGENALLNLANGGGKSVLVQLMLQPVIPDLKLQNRSMSSFFKRSTYPAFIMIEWLLDNDSKIDYLMTGISIAPKSSTDENAGNRINYFTFTSHYEAACDFDLEMVPFVRTEGDNQMILSFEKSREAVKKVTSKHREMQYFSRDDTTAYKQHLSSFGISQDEWKNIIAKMNNDEGGIEELFEKCKTSDSVLNEWIIKTVEKVVHSTGNEEVQIYELFEGLVADTIRNKEYINDQKNIKDYFNEHIKLEESLGKVCEALDSFDKSKQELSLMHGSLGSEIENLNIELKNIVFDKDELNEQMTHILKEELSQRYHDTEETYLESKEIEKECKDELEKFKSKYNSKLKEKDIQEAARIYNKCNELKGTISGLQKQIDNIKSDTLSAERLAALKFSLKSIYNKRKNEKEKHLGNLKDIIESNNDTLLKLKDKLKKDRDLLSKLTSSEGSLKNSIDSFKEYEKDVFAELDIEFSRNMLEETDDTELSNFRNLLISNNAKALSDFESCQKRIDEIKNLTNEVQKEKEEIAILEIKLSGQLKELNEKYKNFTSEKDMCSKILSLNDIPKNLMFDNLVLIKLFDEKIETLEKEVLYANNQELQLDEIVEGIENNKVYNPASLIKYLNENDIYYHTGENYLNNLPEENRIILLENDPILPFSIIIEKNDYKLLEEVYLQNAFLRQIIPVTTYDKLNIVLSSNDNFAVLNDKYSFISSYEPKIFMDKEREKYLLDLKDEILVVKERRKHFETEVSALREGKETIKRFTYDKNYEENLLIELSDCNKNFENTNARKSNLIEESKKLNEEQLEKSKKIESIGDVLRKIKDQNNTFDKYIHKNNKYMEQWKEHNSLIRKMKDLELKINSDEVESNQLIEENGNLSGELKSILYELNDIKKNLLIYSDASECEFIEGTLEELEKEFQVLNEQQGRSLQDLDRKLLDNKMMLEEKQSELLEINLETYEYEGISFDIIKLADLIDDINALSDEVNKRQEHLNKAHEQCIRLEERFKSASKALESQNILNALNKNEIKGNFDNRRKNIKFELKKLNNKEIEYSKKKNLYIRFKDLINMLVRVEILPPISHFSLKEDIEQQFKELKGGYENNKKLYEDSKRKYTKLFSDIKTIYAGKHQSITDIINSIDTLNIEESTYDTIYYYFEELSKKRESLNKFLSFYEQQLMNIEHTKKQVIDQCVSYAALIYEDIKSITDKSRVKLSSRNKNVKMLKIDIPEKIDDNVRNRMEDHISSSVKMMADIYEKNKEDNNKKYRDKIKGIVSTRELLNQFIGSTKIPVSVYKVDLNERNSGLKKWEEAISENSGGEKFVVFFTLVSVLISYTRDATLRRSGQASIKESKVIIMDNPFGKTSSEHLLKAIMDIAETFNIQLICLSDLSQSSITNRFNLIFRLSIRKRMYSNTEVLKIEDLTLNKQGLKEDERLEHAMFYQTSQQENIFDLFDGG